jgi:hypothetical protein
LSRSSPFAASYDRETLKFLRGLSFEEIEALFHARFRRYVSKRLGFRRRLSRSRSPYFFLEPCKFGHERGDLGF